MPSTFADVYYYHGLLLHVMTSLAVLLEMLLARHYSSMTSSVLHIRMDYLLSWNRPSRITVRDDSSDVLMTTLLLVRLLGLLCCVALKEYQSESFASLVQT